MQVVDGVFDYTLPAKWKLRKYEKLAQNELINLTSKKSKKLKEYQKLFGKEGREGPEGRIVHLERQIKRIATIIEEKTKEAA